MSDPRTQRWSREPRATDVPHGPWVGVVWAVMPVLLLIVAGVALVLWHVWGSR